jgi:hypothetical protein
MTGNDTQHAVDVQPFHTNVTETKTAHGFLVPPDDRGGRLSNHFSPLTAGIGVDRRKEYPAIFCVGRIAALAYKSQVEDAEGTFVRASEGYYHSRGIEEMDLKWTSGDNTPWWGSYCRARDKVIRATCV